MGRLAVPGYRDTPGLKKFPPESQFIIYRKVHRRLLEGDPAYRGAYLRFTVLVVGLSMGSAVLQILQVLQIVSPMLATGAGIFFMLLVVVAAFRAQRYRNHRIDWELQKQENCKA